MSTEELHDDTKQDNSASQRLARELEQIKASSEEAIIAKHLQPYSEKDSSGNGRFIFQHDSGLSFSFMGRDELATYPTLQNNHVELLLRPPVRMALDLDQEQRAKLQHRYQDFQKAVGGGEKREHLVVENSTLGVAKLLARLKPDDVKYQTMVGEIERGEYSPASLELSDRLAAAMFMDDSSDEPKLNMDPYGAALLVLSELGDAEAKKLIDARYRRLQQFDSAAQASRQRMGEERVASEPEEVEWYQETFKPDQIVCIHETSYPPQRNSDGAVVLHDTFDHSGFPRASIHFALNHVVEANMMRTGEGASYIVLADLPKLIEANGKPRVLNGVDTWWVRNPGEPLILPDAIIVRLDPSQKEPVIQHGDDITINPSLQDPREYIDRHLIFRPPSEPNAIEGRPVLSGGQHYTNREESITKLASRLGVGHELHYSSAEGGQEDLFGTYSKKNDMERTFGPNNTPWAMLLDMSPQARRVLIASGTIPPVQIVREKDIFDARDLW
jgi:hypothetical protein